MHAIFIAHGPFAQRIKATHQSKRHLATGVKKNTVSHRLPSNGSTSSSSSTAAINEEITVIPGFDNLEIYNLVTKHLLKLDKTAPNNGTAGFWETILEVA